MYTPYRQKGEVSSFKPLLPCDCTHGGLGLEKRLPDFSLEASDERQFRTRFPFIRTHLALEGT